VGEIGAEFCLENLRRKGKFGELNVDIKKIKCIFKNVFHRPTTYFNGDPL
jgi:hypothetical protein